MFWQYHTQCKRSETLFTHHDICISRCISKSCSCKEGPASKDYVRLCFLYSVFQHTMRTKEGLPTVPNSEQRILMNDQYRFKVKALITTKFLVLNKND